MKTILQMLLEMPIDVPHSIARPSSLRNVKTGCKQALCLRLS